MPVVQEFKFHHETLLKRVISSHRPLCAIEQFLGDPYRDILTLEDLGRYTREEVSAIHGVGEGTMSELDLAFRRRGITWYSPQG